MDEGRPERQESPAVKPEAMEQELQHDDPTITERAGPEGGASNQNTTETTDESAQLRELLQTDIRDQDDLERDIGRQVSTDSTGLSQRRWF